jgi:hypothetical protein
VADRAVGPAVGLRHCGLHLGCWGAGTAAKRSKRCGARVSLFSRSLSEVADTGEFRLCERDATSPFRPTKSPRKRAGILGHPSTPRTRTQQPPPLGGPKSRDHRLPQYRGCLIGGRTSTLGVECFFKHPTRHVSTFHFYAFC